MLTGTNLATVIAAVAADQLSASATVRTHVSARRLSSRRSRWCWASRSRRCSRFESPARSRCSPRGRCDFLRPCSRRCSPRRPLLSRMLRRIAGVPVDAESVFLSREDLALLMRRRAADAPRHPHDAILPAEQLMISRIFRFTHAEARKAMVPLVRVDAVPEETSLAAAIETGAARGLQPHPGVPSPHHRYRRRRARLRPAGGARPEPPGQRHHAAGQLFSRIDAARRSAGRAAAHAARTWRWWSTSTAASAGILDGRGSARGNRRRYRRRARRARGAGAAW